MMKILYNKNVTAGLMIIQSGTTFLLYNQAQQYDLSIDYEKK